MTATAPQTAQQTARIEPRTVHTPVVACDGGNGGLGHPRVFLTFTDGRTVVCPYCSQTFVLAEGVKAGHGH